MEYNHITQISNGQGMKENVVRQLNWYLFVYSSVYRHIVINNLFIKTINYNISLLFLKFKPDYKKFTFSFRMCNSNNFFLILMATHLNSLFFFFYDHLAMLFILLKCQCQSGVFTICFSNIRLSCGTSVKVITFNRF